MKYFRSVFDVEYKGRTAQVSSDFVEGIEVFKLKWKDGSIDFIFMDVDGNEVRWQSKLHLPQNKIDDLGLLIEKKFPCSRIVN